MPGYGGEGPEREGIGHGSEWPVAGREEPGARDGKSLGVRNGKSLGARIGCGAGPVVGGGW